MKDQNYIHHFNGNIPYTNNQSVYHTQPILPNQQFKGSQYVQQKKQTNQWNNANNSNTNIQNKYTKQQLQQYQQFQKEVEYETTGQQQSYTKNNHPHPQYTYNQKQIHQIPMIHTNVPLYQPGYQHMPQIYSIYDQPSHIYQQITLPMQPQPQMSQEIIGLAYPPITTLPPMQHEIDWFYGIDGWKLFDSRRCNLIENIMHHNNQPEFEIIYRNTNCIVCFKTMTFYDTEEQTLYKLRRETSISSKPIKVGQGTWSYYNGLTWIQYDKTVTLHLEERLRHGEVNFTLAIDGQDYTFDLDQNVQVCDSLPLGKGDRKIITRQWMSLQQIQEYGRMKKHQEQTYISERRNLEEKVKQQVIQKKALQNTIKQQQRQYWNQMKRQQHQINTTQNLLIDETPQRDSMFNIKDLDLSMQAKQPRDVFQDIPRIGKETARHPNGILKELVSERENKPLKFNFNDLNPNAQQCQQGQNVSDIQVKEEQLPVENQLLQSND